MTPPTIDALGTPLTVVEAAVAAPAPYARACNIPLVSASLGDDPDEITADYWTTPYGQRAALRIGPNLTIGVALASPAALERLADLATGLAEFRRQQIAGGAS